MDRKAYKLPFTKDRISRWMCPSCHKGVRRIKKDTFNAEETNNSKNARGHEAWGPEWIDYVYSCLLECTNPTCKDIVANSGTGSVDVDVDVGELGETHYMYKDFFLPK